MVRVTLRLQVRPSCKRHEVRYSKSMKSQSETIEVDTMNPLFELEGDLVDYLNETLQSIVAVRTVGCGLMFVKWFL
jgi:hypothetical protein